VNQAQTPKSSLGIIAAATGALALVIVLFAIPALVRFGPEHATLTPAWAALGLLVPLALLASALPFAPLMRVGNLVRTLGAIAYALLCLALLIFAHRKYVIVVALFQGLAVWSISGERTLRPWLVAAFATSIASWTLVLGFPWVHMSDWLLNATPSSDFAIVSLIVASLITLYATIDPRVVARVSAWRRVATFGVVGIVYLLFGLRTDNEAATWIPYHQSYFIGPAALVRDHHWLLWDIPSQYGFLSILALAATPGKTTYDAMHTMIAVSLLIQALVVFGLLLWRRWSITGVVFAFLVTSACFYSSQAAYYPFGARLYPQEGLRFVFAIVLIAIAALRTNDNSRRRTVGLWIGHLVWLISILWSFETGVWTTLAWIIYLGVDALALGRGTPFSFIRTLRSIEARALELSLLALGAFATIELVYRAHFGHGPDWSSYLEFSAIYASAAEFVVGFDRFGAGWTLVLILGALVACAAIVIRARRFTFLPVLASCWGALWATSSYYTGEAFNQHVAMLSGILVAVLAVMYRVTDDEAFDWPTKMIVRSAVAPFCILLIAFAFGEPTHVREVQIPYLDGRGASILPTLPKITGELARLERRAGIQRKDPVLYPSTTSWNKLATGLILPLERTGNETWERKAWLPVSPVGQLNTFMTLSAVRRGVYMDRYLDESVHPQGWYITYRDPADCINLSPRLVGSRRADTENYHAIYCRLAPVASAAQGPVPH